MLLHTTTYEGNHNDKQRNETPNITSNRRNTMKAITKAVMQTYNHILRTHILEDRMEYLVGELQDNYELSQAEAATLYHMINIQRGDAEGFDAPPAKALMHHAQPADTRTALLAAKSALEKLACNEDPNEALATPENMKTIEWLLAQRGCAEHESSCDFLTELCDVVMFG
tara:strand:- start:301 stop:810 length:510 start_codon:yes stop_codon:yes gene_type:complete